MLAYHLFEFLIVLSRFTLKFQLQNTFGKKKIVLTMIKITLLKMPLLHLNPPFPNYYLKKNLKIYF